MKKRLTKEQLLEIKAILSVQGFLEKEQVYFLRDKFSFSFETFKRELIQNKIPFKCGSAELSMSSCGIEVIDGKINLDDFKQLGIWSLELFKNSKLRTRFKCKECGEEDSSRLSHHIQREFFKLEPICNNCINKLVRNTKEEKERNSKAQLIAQNRPETKKKMSNIVKKRCSDLNYRKQMSFSAKKVWKRKGYRDKMIKMFNSRYDDVDYFKKVTQHPGKGGIKGFYKKFYYDSGYELAFLLKEEENNNLKNIERAEFYIPYKDQHGVERKYFPDFIKNNETLVEVKGYGPWCDLKKLELKHKAARKWCDNNGKRFRIIEFHDIGNFWYSQAKRTHKKLNNGKDSKKNN